MSGVEHILIIAALALLCAGGLAATRRRPAVTRSTTPRRSLPAVSLEQLTELRPPPASGRERRN